MSNARPSLHHPSSVAAKRQRRHYDQEEEGRGLVGGGGEGKRIFSTKEAGRSMLDALKPSPMEILLTLNKINPGGALVVALVSCFPV